MWCNIHIKFVFHKWLLTCTHSLWWTTTGINKKSFHSRKHIMYTYISSFFTYNHYDELCLLVYMWHIWHCSYLAVCWRNAPISGICPTLAYLGKMLPWILWLCSSCICHCTFVWTFFGQTSNQVVCWLEWKTSSGTSLHVYNNVTTSCLHY